MGMMASRVAPERASPTCHQDPKHQAHACGNAHGIPWIGPHVAISGFRGGIGGFRAAALSGGFRGARFDGFRGRGIRVAGFRRHRGFPIAAGLGFGGWGYYDSCIVWTGYNWVNVCY